MTPVTCTECTPADGIMVGCDVTGPHERHQGTYLHDVGGFVAEVEVSWLTGEPAEPCGALSATESAPADDTGRDAPAPPERPGSRPAPVSDAAVDAALSVVADFWKGAHAILQCYPSRELTRAMLEGAAPVIVAAERARIRRGVLAREMVLQHPADGDRVAVLTLDLEQVIGAEDGS